MVTEKAVYIAGTDGLDSALPDGDTDSLSEADNHIRMLKTVIKNTFPQADVPLLLTSNQINNMPSTITIDATGEYVVLTGPAYDYDTEEDKVLRLDSNNDIELVVEGSYPIGMVFWSMLNLSQMQTKYNKNGAVYVLADGGPASTSTEYYKITNKTTVPNVMESRYIRPTYLNIDTTTVPNIKTLEPPEVVQTEMTAPETGTSFTFDLKVHSHSMYHTHTFPIKYLGLEAEYESGSGGQDVGNFSAANDISAESSMNIEDTTHKHLFTFLNTVTGTKNELNRLTLNPFIRIN